MVIVELVNIAAKVFVTHINLTVCYSITVNLKLLIIHLRYMLFLIITRCSMNERTVVTVFTEALDVVLTLNT